MDTALQLSVFVCLTAAGAAMGFIYDLFSLVTKALSPPKIKKITVCLTDVLFFAVAAVLYLYIAATCRLPDFRMYFYLAILLGVIIYCKSMRIVIAFFKKMCYNSLVKVRKKWFFPLFNALNTQILQKKHDWLKRKSARLKKSPRKKRKSIRTFT